MKLCCIVVLILSVAIPAQAQDPATDAPRKLIISDRAIAAALAEHPPAQPGRARDSIANGALIGGLLSGVAVAGVGGWVCHQLKEPDDPSCWPGILRVGVISFGIGAVAGGGIDLLISRSPAQPFKLGGGPTFAAQPFRE